MPHVDSPPVSRVREIRTHGLIRGSCPDVLVFQPQRP